MGTATGALTTFADFLKVHDKEVAKAITLLPKLYVAFKGFKIVSAIAPGVKTFCGRNCKHDRKRNSDTGR